MGGNYCKINLKRRCMLQVAAVIVRERLYRDMYYVERSRVVRRSSGGSWPSKLRGTLHSDGLRRW